MWSPRHPLGVLKRPPWAETAACSPPAGHSGPEARSPGPCVWNDALLVSRLPHEHKPKPCETGGEAREWAQGAGHAQVSHTEAGRDQGGNCCTSPEKQMSPTGPRSRGGGHKARRPHSPGLQDDVLVQGFLPVGEAALQHVLVLLRQLLFHVSLGSPQDKRLRHLKEEHDALFLIHGATRTGDPLPRPPSRPHIPCASV